MLVDIHAHLEHADFNIDRTTVIERAKKAGVKAIINNAVGALSMHKVLSLSKLYDVCHAALGLYPDTIVTLQESQIEQLLTFMREHTAEFIAVGEIGLDYKNTLDPKDREKQQIFFRKQIQLAKELDKPMLIHSRNAEVNVIDILEEEKAAKVVLHCFCGSLKLVRRAVKLGYYFSISTRVVADAQFQAITKLVPLSHMFTETDSPYLHWIRGKRNEPANITESVKKIAEIKEMTEKEVTLILFANFQRIFNQH